MSKLVALIAVLVVVLSAAEAFRTITTTTVVTDGESEKMEQCQYEVQRVDLDPCMEYLAYQMVPESRGAQAEQEKMEMCCMELRKLENKQCVCEGLEMKMGQLRPGMASQMRSVAMNLPGMCRVSPPTCHFSMMSMA